MAIIGIDLGTTNSLVCVCQDGRVRLVPGPLGDVLTPSVVSVEENGEICIGAVAKERLITHPSDTAASFKRYMGTEKVFTLAGRSFTPQELSSFVLRQLKEDAERFLGEAVTEAVISVPAYFNDDQRYATREAGRLAGIYVERLINEPSAAALAASRISGQEEGSYLVFDLGGGTLDVSVVDYFENVIEIVAVSGDTHLGGNDFDEVIARSCCKAGGLNYEDLEEDQKASLLRLSEKCKKELTVQKEAVITFGPDEQPFTLTNMLLAESCQTLFDRIGQVLKNVLRDSSRTIHEIDEIVLVGGSSRMPVIFLFLQTFLGKTPCMIGSPDEIVAAGVGTYAGIKERKQEIRDLVLTDICPFTLGTSIVNYSDVTRPVMSPIIERNSILPSSKTGYYTNARDGQSHISIGIYQGEAYYCEDNVELGTVEMDILPVRKGEARIEIRFTYDINGILEVEVTDHVQKRTERAVIAGRHFRLSEQELDRRLKELNAYKLSPPGGIRTRLVLARGERMFVELVGEERKEVACVLQRLQEALEGQNDQKISNCLRESEAVFDRLDGTEP